MDDVIVGVGFHIFGRGYLALHGHQHEPFLGQVFFWKLGYGFERLSSIYGAYGQFVSM